MTHAFEFTYDGESRPLWNKIFTAQSGEVFSASLGYENSQDRELLTLEEVVIHLNNLMQYCKDVTNGLSVVGMNDSPVDSFFPVTGTKTYEEAEWALQEIQKWWNWAYYNDAFDEEEPA